MKALEFSILFLFLVLIFTTCKKEPDYPQPKVIHYSGQVFDRYKKPLGNVKIYIGEQKSGSSGTPEPIDVFASHESTVQIETDSLGRFSVNYLDPHPFSKYEEHSGYNMLSPNYLRFIKDGFFDHREPDYYNYKTALRFDSVILHKHSFVKIILNPLSQADGIELIGLVNYQSNLYSKGDGGCRTDNPRNAEFIVKAIADWNYKINWYIFPGGYCNKKDNTKTIRTNPDNKTR